MKIDPISILLVLLIGLLILSSCNPDLIIIESKAIDGDWAKEDTIGFEFVINDTLTDFSFYINIRHSMEYPYSNIYFFVSTEFPNGNFSNDTIECVLADVRGKWYGTGLGDIKENKILIRKNLQFPVTGFYRFNFVQAMREDQLSGLSDIGIEISKTSAN